MNELVLRFPAQPGYVGMARTFAASVARHFGCSEERVDDVKIAISEACNNAVRAHEDAAVIEPIQIVAGRDANKLWFDVVDAGPGFDLALTEGSTTHAPGSPPPVLGGGLGLLLIDGLLPGSTVTRNADRGMTARLTIPTEG